MTTTHTSDTSAGNERPNHARGPRGGGFGGPCGAARFDGPGDFVGRRHVPVNIEDTPDTYVLSLYAAGLDKSEFEIKVQGDVLSIRHEAAAPEDGTRQFTRRERVHGSFTREFALNAKVQVEAISASYRDGVLTVRMPKTPEAMQPAHTVAVQ